MPSLRAYLLSYLGFPYLGHGVSPLCCLLSLRHAAPVHQPEYHTIALISHTGKVMLKILQARLQQYMNRELPDVQARFRKGRGSRDQIANIRWILVKQRVPGKHLLLLY